MSVSEELLSDIAASLDQVTLHEAVARLKAEREQLKSRIIAAFKAGFIDEQTTMRTRRTSIVQLLKSILAVENQDGKRIVRAYECVEKDANVDYSKALQELKKYSIHAPFKISFIDPECGAFVEDALYYFAQCEISRIRSKPEELKVRYSRENAPLDMDATLAQNNKRRKDFLRMQRMVLDSAILLSQGPTDFAVGFAKNDDELESKIEKIGSVVLTFCPWRVVKEQYLPPWGKQIVVKSNDAGALQRVCDDDSVLHVSKYV